MKARLVVAPTLMAALVVACASTNQNGNAGDGDNGNASMTFALSGGDFTGNSVRICGSRVAPDPKYRCNWSLTPDIEAGTDAGDACPCFNFNADGSLMDGTGAPAVITGLCPSADYPPANWDFSYALFASPDCQGTRLNDGDHNFTCYDSKDIATQKSPNQSANDVLNSGPNTNHILCNTVNASKQWNFASCATATTASDMGVGNVRFNCGCTPDGGGTCDCGDGGVTAGDLEDGCTFDLTTCEIVCGSPEERRVEDELQGSCTGASAQSTLVRGTDVVSYVPRAAWGGGGTGISVVNVEGSSITPTRIPTAIPVNSCASNSITGRTVCTTHNTTVYILSNVALTDTLTSDATGDYEAFSGGNCRTCTATMDPIKNRALIGIAMGYNIGGYQFLDLTTDTFLPPFLTQTPNHEMAEAPLLDPIRNLILSPVQNSNTYEIIDISDPSAPKFFERDTGLDPSVKLEGAGADCATGIILGSAESSYPSLLFVADLTQSTFTPGSPGSWTGAAQVQTLTESSLITGAAAVAVAQGTHQGIVNGEFGGATVTAIQLPSTSGAGMPAITDWVTCDISGSFATGLDPHTTTAYRSPNGGHAMATVVNIGASQMAVIDLTMMLDPTIVPRTSGPGLGHACTSGTLPSSVVRFISLP